MLLVLHINLITILFTISTEKWALCYRQFPHANTDTNMYLERLLALLTDYLKTEMLLVYIHTLLSFHNNLKTHYLNGKVNRRIDYLVCALLEVESDYFFKFNKTRIMGEANQKLVKEEQHHQRGMLIPELSVEVRSYTLC